MNETVTAALNTRMNASVQHVVDELNKPGNHILKTAFLTFNTLPEVGFMFDGFEDFLTKKNPPQALATWKRINDEADDIAGGHSGASFGFMCRKAAAILSAKE